MNETQGSPSCSLWIPTLPSGVALCTLLWALTAFVGITANAQVDYRVLRGFGFGEQSGYYPFGTVIEGSDGALYGTARYGGNYAAGAVFKVQKDGTAYVVLHHLGSSPNDGKQPKAGLLEGSDGALYGTTELGGSSGLGAVFRVSKDGTEYSVLYEFTGTGGDAQNPWGGLVEDTSGWLYGTTYNGGAGGKGTIFMLAKDGSYYTVLRSFLATGGDGQNPMASLILGTDGLLYGTTSKGGSSGKGTVFRMSTSGSGYFLLHAFSSASSDGANPYGPLRQGRDGLLYGTTYFGGSSGYGTVFKLRTDSTGFSVMRSFANSANAGVNPRGGLVEGYDGALYGTCNYGGNCFGTVFRITKDATSYQILHVFIDYGDGQNPDAGLVQASDGALYGTTDSGGGNSRGTIFKINGLTYNLVWSFDNSGGADSKQPKAAPILASNSVLYGTAYSGGSYGAGTVFSMTTNGTDYIKLHEFGAAQDGRNPSGALVEAGDAALYGTTELGGSGNQGTLFRIEKVGSGYSIIHNFATSAGEGQTPRGPLLTDASGWLYGVTLAGGLGSNGTAFKIQTNSSGYTILHHFGTVDADGRSPNGGLALGIDGALYGTTLAGGASNFGTVFRINKDGTGYALLHHFGTTTNEAQSPQAGVLAGSDRALYGTTYAGGSSSKGTVFSLGVDGSGYRLLQSFSGKNGQFPAAALMESMDGLLYGTTTAGGSSNYGTVFVLGKDGTSLNALLSFGSGPTDGRSPSAAIVESPDGVLFGSTQAGAAFAAGTVFRLLPARPPRITELRSSGGLIAVQFRGLDGHQYQVLRSVDLLNWYVLDTITMSPSCVYTFEDLSPPGDMAFYRIMLSP
jgi:uncharacterized repeat protein (TIGR03803 family)